MKFNEFGFSEPILNAIRKERYIEATPIQEICIPEILNDKDIIGIAQTGTGKTAAFALPILEKLIIEKNQDRKIRALILSPTRELAIQIRDNFVSYSVDTNFKCSVILGGVNQQSQINTLKKGVDILVATPGRLLDLCKSKKVDLTNVEMLVLDEADTMLDMGFVRDVKQIIKKTPRERQTMLFSATMSKEVEELASEFLKNPITLTSAPVSSAAPKIEQVLYYVDKKNKFDLLLDLLNKERFKSTLIFTRTKHGADKLEKQFAAYNINCSVIHGNKTQSNRVRALGDFKSNKTSILIATDIAARGIDINDLSHVINFDMPESPELYVHRIGRTARAGHEGIAISLVSYDEISKLRSVERLIKTKIKELENTEYPMIDKSPKKEIKFIPRKRNENSSRNNNAPRNNDNRNNNRGNFRGNKRNFMKKKSSN